MTISISADRKLSSINEEFNKVFPFLQLQFFKSPHKEDEPSLKKEMYSHNLLVSDIQPAIKNGTIELSDKTIVADLESLFSQHFKLNVQVFRKSGRVWLETSGTDSFSLKKLNELGKEKSIPTQTVDITDIDYD